MAECKDKFKEINRSLVKYQIMLMEYKDEPEEIDLDFEAKEYESSVVYDNNKRLGVNYRNMNK